MERSRPGPGPLGIVSVLFGTLALLVCWIPLVQVLAIPMLLLGGLAGILGILTSLVGRRSAVGWPMTGLSMSALAFYVGLVVSQQAAEWADKNLKPAPRPLPPAVVVPLDRSGPMR
jgi:hypothetical protein